MAGDALVHDYNLGVLAGIIMGEGCLDLNHATPRLRVKMADRPVLDWIQERFPGIINTMRAKNGRWMWEWYLGGTKATSLLQDLQGHLVGSKARQAQILLDIRMYPTKSETFRRLKAELSQLKRISYEPHATR